MSTCHWDYFIVVPATRLHINLCILTIVVWCFVHAFLDVLISAWCLISAWFLFFDFFKALVSGYALFYSPPSGAGITATYRYLTLCPPAPGRKFCIRPCKYNTTSCLRSDAHWLLQPACMQVLPKQTHCVWIEIALLELFQITLWHHAKLYQLFSFSHLPGICTMIMDFVDFSLTTTVYTNCYHQILLQHCHTTQLDK